ncbi:MAG: RidA family protein [Burkholderiaceae bacterium]|nr:RidA family protein [Burkholderiaceae bacterium]
MTDREPILPAGMETLYHQMHYAPAVRAGRTVYVSGQIGRNEKMELLEDKEAQFVQTFENLKKVLAAAGATLADVVDVTSFHTDMRDLPLYMQVRDRYFTDSTCYPAWTAIGAAQLCGAPGYFLEVKAVAVLPG